MEMASLYSMEENATTEVQPSTLDRLISFKDPTRLATENWFALILEIVVYYVLLRAFQHARQRGTSEVFLLASAWFAGLGLELLQQIPNPGYQLWWYHQGMVNLLNHRVPAFIPSFVAVIYYYVDYMTRNTKLPLVAQSAVNAIVATMLMFPCLWLASKMLLVLVHFDDPLFYDRILNVSIAQITFIFLLFFHIKHNFIPSFEEIEPHESHFFRYLKCSIQSGLLTASFSIVEVYLLHMLFKNLFKGHLLLCPIFATIIILCLVIKEFSRIKYTGYTKSGIVETLNKKEWIFLVAFFAFILLVPILVNTENLKSNGERLERGPCDVTHLVSNMSPLEVVRRRYVCPEDTRKFGFNFHCVPVSELASSEIKKKYTICGTPFENVSRLTTIFSLYSIGCLTVFYFILSFSLTIEEKKEKVVHKTID